MAQKPLKIPTFRHHRPTAQAVFTLNGKDHYVGRWDKPDSKEKYDKLIQEWLSNDGSYLNQKIQAVISGCVN